MADQNPEINNNTINGDSLRMEYEQTVQTLRNWDTLFFQAISTVILGGGISAGITIFTDLEETKVKLFSLLIITALILVMLMYFLYSYMVARTKIEILREIEVQLGLIGAYGKSSGKSQNTFWISLFITVMAYLIFIIVLFGKFSINVSIQ